MKVRVGDFVSFGDVIAAVGSSGLSTAAHVHFEVRVRGEPVDPLKHPHHGAPNTAREAGGAGACTASGLADAGARAASRGGQARGDRILVSAKPHQRGGADEHGHWRTTTASISCSRVVAVALLRVRLRQRLSDG